MLGDALPPLIDARGFRGTEHGDLDSDKPEIITGTLAAYWYARRRGAPFARWADIVAPTLFGAVSPDCWDVAASARCSRIERPLPDTIRICFVAQRYTPVSSEGGRNIYSSNKQASVVADEIARGYKPVDRLVDPAGHFLRYGRDYIAVLPAAGGGSTTAPRRSATAATAR